MSSGLSSDNQSWQQCQGAFSHSFLFTDIYFQHVIGARFSHEPKLQNVSESEICFEVRDMMGLRQYGVMQKILA